MSILLLGCGLTNVSEAPAIQFTRLPQAGEGSSEKLDPIEGRITGARPGQRVVLFAKSGVWWVQPVAEEPFTAIQKDATWKSSTHPGSAYAALLVDGGYHPPLKLDTLPETGGHVIAVARADSAMLGVPEIKKLQFSGYDWRLRQAPGNAGGWRNYYDAVNAWTDRHGFLHLRIAGQPNHWTGAEATLTRSLGYGSYRFVIGDISRLEPAAALSISTWDDFGPPREMNIEISRWGETAGKNAQYVIQPYYIPANTVRFTSPPGALTYALHWEPGRASFKTWRAPNEQSGVIASHVFTSGVPLPGNETIKINFYVFNNKRNPLQHASEVVIEKFEYLP